MEYDDFVFRKLLKELSGQVIYQIKEDSSTIDFKFIKDGNNNEIVTYFRFDKYIENPNSVEVNLREYIDNNHIFWVSRQKILYFMIDQMRNLFGSSYFYNIDVFGKLVEVTISLKDYELEGFNIFGRIISEKIDKLKENYKDSFIREYNNYSKFNEIFDFDEDYKLADVKTKYFLYNEFGGKTLDVKIDSVIYQFKIISDLKPKIKISFNCEKNPSNPIERYIINYIKDNYEKKDIFGNEISIDDYMNKKWVKNKLLNGINYQLSLLFNSRRYNFKFVNSKLSYSNISVISSFDYADFDSIHDVLVYSIREEILNFDFPVNYFDNLSVEWDTYKKASHDKNRLNGILDCWGNDEKEFKLNHIFETELKNKVILTMGDVSFKISDINKSRFKLFVNPVHDGYDLHFKPRKNSIPNFYVVIYDSPFYFNNAKYYSELMDDTMVIERHSNYIFNSDGILERNIRNILLNLLLNDEFMAKLDKLWQDKIDNDKKLEEEKIIERKKIKSDYDDIIRELDGHSNIKGDSVRW